MPKQKVSNETMEEKESEHFTAKVTRKPNCVCELEIFVKPTATESAYQKALKAINKEVSIPGFRKGKAPSSLIEKNYAKALNEEWREILANTLLKELFNNGLPMPYQRKLSHFQIDSIERKEGAKIRLSYEAEPVIPTISLSELSFEEVEPKEVTEKEKEGLIDHLRHENAEWNPLDDHPAEEMDYVDLTIDILDSPAHNLVPSARIRVDREIMPNWLYSLVLGKRQGDVFEGVSEKEEERFLSGDLFSPTQCKIQVNRVWQCQLPELNDEWVKKLGFENLEAFHQAIERNLAKQKQDQAFEEMKRKLSEQLLIHFSFDIPHSVLDSEVKRRQSIYLENYTRKKYSKEDISRLLKEKENEIHEESLQSLLLTNLIVKLTYDKQIEISSEELSQELSTQLWATPLESRVIHSDMEPNEIREALDFAIRERKGWQRVIDHLQKPTPSDE